MALTLERSGPRQIWRFVVFVAAAILMGRFVEGAVVEFVARHLGIDPDALSAPALIVDEVVSLAEVFVLTGLFALLERRRVNDYGLNLSPAPGKFFVKGTWFGVAMVAFVGVAMVLAGGMRVDGLALSPSAAVVQTLLWAIAMVLLGISEEYSFRGYALQSLWRSVGFWPAAVVTSGLFAAAHLGKPQENAIDITMIFVVGVILCVSVRQTGHLWWAVGWHAAFDFGQLYVIGTQNGGQVPVGRLLNSSFPGPAWINGGQLGTEASFFMYPAVAAMVVYVWWYLGREKSVGK
jgi:membrane protease YdiL (CAAX protease family)